MTPNARSRLRVTRQLLLFSVAIKGTQKAYSRTCQ
jgi:hypothetical protein